MYTIYEMTEVEIFRPIVIDGLVTRYEVSNTGKIKSLIRGIIMKTSSDTGYETIDLQVNSHKKRARVHRLVATAFIDNPNKFPEVDHKNGDKFDNKASNLEWVTGSENCIRAQDTIVRHHAVGINQLSLNGEFIKTFKSIKEASTTTGVHNRNIRSACNGEYHQSGGYKWEYVDKRVKEEIPEGKHHPDHPGYIITTGGRIFSLKTNRYMTPRKRDNGYLSVMLALGKDRCLKFFYIHTLVATVYIPKEPGKDRVNHKDLDKSNNRVENLEWVTAKENAVHAMETGSNACKRPVIQYSLDDVEIQRFPSLSAAAGKCSVSSKSISSVCRGKQGTAGNFKWKYAEDRPNPKTICNNYLTLNIIRGPTTICDTNQITGKEPPTLTLNVINTNNETKISSLEDYKNRIREKNEKCLQSIPLEMRLRPLPDEDDDDL